ncbi:hypothetical protein ACFQ3Z_00930 [Streptomyces nogalater]
MLNRLPADLAAVTQGRSTYARLAAEQCRVLSAAARTTDRSPPIRPARPSSSSTCCSCSTDTFRRARRPSPPAAGGPGGTVRPVSSLDPHMSYELLIDVNCAEWETTGHIRVFSDGELGRLERDFYLGHHLAEPAVRGAFDRLSSLVLEPDAVDPAAALEEALRGLDDFRRYMAQYGRLPRKRSRRSATITWAIPAAPARAARSCRACNCWSWRCWRRPHRTSCTSTSPCRTFRRGRGPSSPSGASGPGAATTSYRRCSTAV